MLDLLVPERLEESRRLLGDETVSMLQRVFLDSLRVVEEVGFRCPSEDVRELLEQTGLAAVDETTGHMHLLGDLVRQSLQQTPKNDAFWLPWQSFGIGGTAPYFRDDRTGELVEAKPEDIRRLAKAVEQTDLVAFMGRGVKLDGANAEAIRIMADNTSKVIYVGAHSSEEIELVDGIHRSRGRIFVIWDVIQSPLSLSKHMVECFLDCVRRGIPICLASMPMPAISAPFSASGLLTMAFAEFLVGLCIVQTLRPGTLVLCGSLPSVTDIKRRYALDFGGKYQNVVNMLVGHLPRLLDIPACQSGCTTNEKGPTPRAINDARMGYAMFSRYGCHLIRHAFGFTKDLIGFSFEKMEAVVQAYRQTSARDAPDLRIPSYDPEGFDVIARNSSNASYMQDPHTLANTGREFTDP